MANVGLAVGRGASTANARHRRLVDENPGIPALASFQNTPAAHAPLA
jgi:hypothetical protein